MLLAIDVGNTVTHFGLFSKDKLIREKCLETRHVRGGASNMSKNWTYDVAVVCSVVPDAIPKTGVPTLIVSHKLNLGLRVKYKNPAKVGADRLANAVAAKFLYGYPALVIDFGTAVTIDVVSMEGDYLGGVIMPGIDIMRYGLKERTALLPLVPFKKPTKVLGSDTEAAIQAGIFYGINGMVRELIPGLKKELRFPQKTVIISTGGYAELFGGKVDKFLTLKGLKIIYERNRDNRSAFVCK